MEQPKQMIVEFNNTQIVCEGTELQMIEEMSLEYIDIILNIESYDDKHYFIKLPIKTINGLLCECSLQFQYYLPNKIYQPDIDTDKPFYRVFFKVISPKLSLGEHYNYANKRYYEKKLFEDTQTEYTLTDLTIIFIKSKYLLSNLKYCYVENELTFKPSHILLLSSIFENPNIELNCEECSVCRITTTNKTPCNHSLCFICWEQIKENENEIIPCPLCREDITNVE
jgi:hypothetical protein